MKEVHVLVDYENVQPTMEELLKLAPHLTDVWLFHRPNQIKRAEQLQAAHARVTLVPHSGEGKNALDFHLSFYLGYVAAKHPTANLMVIANDKGYDSMIGHATLLGFTAVRVGFDAKKAPVARKQASPPAKKVAAKKAAMKRVPAKKVTAAPSGRKAEAAAAKVPAAKKAPAKKAPAKKTSAKKVSAVKPAPGKAAPNPADKVLVRAKTALDKMGKNRPTKLAALLRHLKSIVGQEATHADADALSRRLQDAKVIQVVGELVLYP